MAGAVSRWLGSVEGLPEIVHRLQRVQIENVPAHDVVLRYDSPETLFYCDPPYPHEARGDSKAYGYEMTDAEHEQLAGFFARCAVQSRSQVIAVRSWTASMETGTEWTPMRASATHKKASAQNPCGRITTPQPRRSQELWMPPGMPTCSTARLGSRPTAMAAKSKR